MAILNGKDKKRHTTGGKFYCRDGGYFSVCASNKLSCYLTVKCFEIGNKNIPPNRYGQVKKTAQHNEKDNKNFNF